MMLVSGEQCMGELHSSLAWMACLNTRPIFLPPWPTSSVMLHTYALSPEQLAPGSRSARQSTHSDVQLQLRNWVRARLAMGILCFVAPVHVQTYVCVCVHVHVYLLSSSPLAQRATSGAVRWSFHEACVVAGGLKELVTADGSCGQRAQSA